ncbi:MAG: ATP-binding protein [Burkholderiaceae bacterium]
MTRKISPDSVLAGGGEMGQLMRSIDWRQTALGPVERWPQSLRTALSILMETGFPMYIAWGREFTQFYNDGYRSILGSTKHPSAMGRSTRETFAEVWDVIGPMFEGVMEGRPTTLFDFMLPMDRHGFAEECYFIFSYSPIRDESGEVGGVLVTVTESTQRVLGERRLKVTQRLAVDTHAARTVSEACTIAAAVLCADSADLPFFRIYLASADRQSATLCAHAGTAPEAGMAPLTIRLDDAPFAAALHATPTPLLQAGAAPAAATANRPASPAAPAVGRTLVLPITHAGSEQPVGVLVLGTSVRLLLDQAYQDFLRMVASQIGTAIAGAQAFEDAKARAEALAELDRAKTAFFSNVSHEFRTPLTLMLGPLAEALASPERSLQGQDLAAVHRNAERLLRLVNTLLDFSRIEAGRINARFEPTDLAGLSADLASAFRSATERAGLALVVDCPPLAQPVYVDHAMWETIVLNLLSNAFKYTLQGEIRVELGCDGGFAELRVRDTGTGIAAQDLEHVFDRFYRIGHPGGRTVEGSGIGLALVRELVLIHGGSIEAASQPGQGTVFTVRVPLGVAHLAPECIADAPRAAAPAALPGARAAAPSALAAARSYVQEALRWLPAEPGPDRDAPPDPQPAPPNGVSIRVLVADDNADMREYLTRLLSARFTVETVGDGRAALDAAQRLLPDVIVSDVMMPGLDGFELLAALREHDATRAIPVILLSARAGEEARIDGLQAGADDYLVKPFSARELVARVEAQLVRLKLRALEQAHAVRLASVFASAPVGVALLSGPEHRFEFANHAYLELLDHRPVVGKAIRAALPELAGQGIYELLDRVYRSGEPFVGRSVAISLRRDDGHTYEGFFDFSYQPLFDPQQAVSGIAVVAFDVTDLTTARREAEAANRAKDEFLAMLGHELRNPLAPIVTALQIMRLRALPGGERERTIIERQVKHVVALVDDLLDVSRITRGQVQLRREHVDMADIVAKALEMTGSAIEARQHALTLDTPRGLRVHGDAARLAQVVANLLTNAAKYTDAGGSITVTGRRVGDRIELVVTDSGRGISAEMLPRVLDMFSQERQEIDRREGGLGLGLAIVKNLVREHGGTVHAGSEGKGRGSAFTVALPFDAQPHEPLPGEPPRPEGAATHRFRVLVVDDNADAADVLAESLRVLGHQTRTAAEGAGALQALAVFQPEVVLLDLGLPGMDGFEVARRMRALPHGRDVRLVALTGYGRDIDRQRTRDAGFDEHMVKPVGLPTLDDWLRSQARGSAA